jgi:TPR repeat protein
MLLKIVILAFCSVLLGNQLQAAASRPIGDATFLSAGAEGPAREAFTAFREGRHAKAVELAKPLAEKGDPSALFLIGYSYETGQGLDASRDSALENYRKAAATGHQDATHRLSLILLASGDQGARTQALAQLEQAAAANPAVAGRILGEAWLRGLVAKEPDLDKTVLWWAKAAEAGDLPAMLLLASLYDGQLGFPANKDETKSLALYTRAAELGNGPAMAALGSRLLSGGEQIRNEQKGREWLKRAIEKKEYSAYLALGDFEKNLKRDAAAAFAAYESGRNAGQVDCMLRSADAFLEGDGTVKDPIRGMEVLESAAKAGSSVAHYRLAAIRLKAEPPDLLAGYRHLLVAASGGVRNAQYDLALFYLAGKLSALDATAGVAWLTLAAHGGHAEAQFTLAVLYLEGRGVRKSLGNAGQLYSLAANQGHAGATFAIAQFHGRGLGIPTDLPKAWALATLAVERGDDAAKAYADEIDTKLNDPQRAAARRVLEDIKSGKTALDVQVRPPGGHPER